MRLTAIEKCVYVCDRYTRVTVANFLDVEEIKKKKIFVVYEKW